MAEGGGERARGGNAAASPHFPQPAALPAAGQMRTSQFPPAATLAVMSCCIERLLDAVYKYPVLYVADHEEYKNLKKKDKIWDEIGKTLNASGKELKSKWRNIRDTYIKHLRSLDPSQAHVNVKKNYTAWPRAAQMEKFKPFLGTAKNLATSAELQDTNSNYEVFPEPDVRISEDYNVQAGGEIDQSESLKATDLPDESIDEFYNVQIKSEILDINHLETAPRPPKPQFKRRKKQSPTKSSNPEKVVLRVEGSEKMELDATDHLMLGYSKTIKSFSRARQAEIKLKIAQLINQGELDQIREDDQTSCTTVGTWHNPEQNYANNGENETTHWVSCG